MMLLLFALLFCCLAANREGVWTRYSSQDIVRWQTAASRETTQETENEGAASSAAVTPGPGKHPVNSARELQLAG
ncbi:hypothetical protein [Hymenobacter seoulensis]